MDDGMLLVFTNSVEGRDEDFNKWYDTRHIGDILKVPGIVAAQRYELAPMTLPEGDDAPAELPPPAHRYLTIYTISGDPDAVMKEFLQRAGTDQLELSEALDLTTVSIAAWRPRGELRSAKTP
jgi:hypothetical protein